MQVYYFLEPLKLIFVFHLSVLDVLSILSVILLSFQLSSDFVFFLFCRISTRQYMNHVLDLLQVLIVQVVALWSWWEVTVRPSLVEHIKHILSLAQLLVDFK